MLASWIFDTGDTDFAAFAHMVVALSLKYMVISRLGRPGNVFVPLIRKQFTC